MPDPRLESLKRRIQAAADKIGLSRWELDMAGKGWIVPRGQRLDRGSYLELFNAIWGLPNA